MAAPQPHYAEDPSLFPVQGGCSCGLVRYSLDAVPLCVHCCHCTACQREQGSAFAINIMIEATAFRLLPPVRPVIPASRFSHAASAAVLPARPEMLDPAALGLQPGAAGDGVHDPLLLATPSESGVPHRIARCPRCFVAVFSEYAGTGPHVRFVVGGTLDRPWEISPDIHIFTASKREFVELRDGKPQFEEYYDRTTVWRPDALERIAKMAPQVAEYRAQMMKELAASRAEEESGK